MTHFPHWFPFFFIGLFVFVLFILSRKDWSDLAREFRFDNHFKGKRVRVVSISINCVNYNNSLVLQYNEEGSIYDPFYPTAFFTSRYLFLGKESSLLEAKKILFVYLKEMVSGRPLLSLCKYESKRSQSLRRWFLQGPGRQKEPNSCGVKRARNRQLINRLKQAT